MADKSPDKIVAEWLLKAQASEPNDYDAAALATTDAKGRADIRMVLVRNINEKGFVFFTHQGSAKGKQLADNPNAALNFHWKSWRRQIRVRGKIELVSEKEADDYFAQRPRDHQLNAHASRQSKSLKNNFELVELFANARKKFARAEIPRPKYWVGYCLVPVEIEFWTSKRSRQHDRTLYYRSNPKKVWQIKKLFP